MFRWGTKARRSLRQELSRDELSTAQTWETDGVVIRHSIPAPCSQERAEIYTRAIQIKASNCVFLYKHTSILGPSMSLGNIYPREEKAQQGPAR